MKCDRRDSLATSSEALADALEHHRIEQLGPLVIGTHRQGVGCLFVAPSSRPGEPPLKPLALMPPKPTLVDFFKLRFTPGPVSPNLPGSLEKSFTYVRCCHVKRR
jgi:hypothetical protein